jgi:hypothetical protein
MQAVTPVVDPNSIELKAAGIAAYDVALFQHGHACARGTRELIRGTHSSGAGTKNHNVRQVRMLSRHVRHGLH